MDWDYKTTSIQELSTPEAYYFTGNSFKGLTSKLISSTIHYDLGYNDSISQEMTIN